MNFKVLAIAMVSVAASGCATMHKAESAVTYRDEPLVKQVEMGMTQEQVRALGGPPSQQYTRRVKPGTCNQYVLEHEGNQQVYQVSFDAKGRVESKGFETCESADHY
jgi:osmotically inducible lipoprotein OsmE